MPHAAIELRSVAKAYRADAPAVREVSFALHRGTLAALLGPSGCGKTTTLRLIAGLEAPDSGEIWLDGRCVAGAGKNVPPEKRRIGMVFQDYALFPHLTVRDNVAFGLDGIKAPDRAARVTEMLRLVGLAEYGLRYPHELSGGQQQRVALARALALRPSVVLLDEPFSNLDAALRRNMRKDLHSILHAANVTAVFVTHDQEEALSIADTVAVMQRGSVVQIGTPHDVYLRPATREIARFVGEANFLRGEADGDSARCGLGTVRLLNRAHGAVDVMVRPEGLRVHSVAGLDCEDCAAGHIEKISYYGHDQLAVIRLTDGELVQARMRPLPGVAVGAPVNLEFRGAALAYPV
jgi:iron(III) transport system ATP-binding protein